MCPPTSYPTTTYTESIENTSTTSTWQLRLSDPIDCLNAAAGRDAVQLRRLRPGLEPVRATQPDQDRDQHDAGRRRAGVAELRLAAAPRGRRNAQRPDAHDRAGDRAHAVFAGRRRRRERAVPRHERAGRRRLGRQHRAGPEGTVTLSTQLRPTTRVGRRCAGAGHREQHRARHAARRRLPGRHRGGRAERVASTLANGNLQVATTKAFTPTHTLQAAPTDPILVDLGARSTGTLAPKVLVIEDSAATFWNAFTLKSFTLPNTPTNADRVQVDAQTGQGAQAVWTSGTPTTIATAALPAGVTAAAVTGLRFTYTRADGGAFAASANAVNVRLSVSLRSALRDGSRPGDLERRRRRRCPARPPPARSPTPCSPTPRTTR